ncbi:WD repeat-containing protein wdr-5.1 [Hondaea fermentalgiana]|uniref:WD repeat-containing protein wdr-5.1 n=1 Tax=Hondaea fermentalgiana TaxID=2315210 RepID=A0A2R5GMX7_9STRA|nr:WD repeat-containing protein wdr-5.1 [Hondaea fermentalgiana]|eukprot:GBG32246.1 WD repeat-containing protein wdr-5.1 [Hondaea fermentalgiana]
MVRRWRNVRVFISSTFRDTHFERDALTRLIFPELRQWCEERYLHVTEVDLRWGVTQEESAAGKAIEICLDEIDRSDIFLCLVGSRYGWVPDQYEVGTESRFVWVTEQEGLSITELEIMRGALNSQDTLAENVSHALFYFRNEDFLEKLKDTPKQLCEFTDGHTVYKSGELVYVPNEEKQTKLQALKQRIRDEATHKTNAIKTVIHEDYPSLYHTEERLSETNESAMRQFCAMILTDLKRAIDERYPITLRNDESNVEEVALENTYHQAYMDFRLSQYLARDAIVSQVVDFARREVVLDKMPLLVFGESGVGKSSVLAKVCEILQAEQAQHENPACNTNGSSSDANDTSPLSAPLQKVSATKETSSTGRSDVAGLAAQLGASSLSQGKSPGGQLARPSGLLAKGQKKAQGARTKPSVLIRFFAGASPGSLHIHTMLRILVQELRRCVKKYRPKKRVDQLWTLLRTSLFVGNSMTLAGRLKDKDSSASMRRSGKRHHYKILSDVPSTYGQLVEEFRRLLVEACEYTRLVLVLDNLDHLEPSSPFSDSGVDYRPRPLGVDASGSANFLFPEFNQFEQFEQRSFLESFQLHFRQHLKLHVPRLSREEAEVLICARLGQYGKKLSKTQMGILLNKASSGNPTWIVIACEELRVFNLYEKVTERILELAEDLQSLLDQMISRLELDHGPRFVRDALSILLCSRDGLFENEIVGILGVPLSSWSQLYYSIKPLLTNHTRSGDELISFSHYNFSLAILKRYFATSAYLTPEEVSLLPMRSPQAIPIHARLSKFFHESAFDANGAYNSENGRALSCLPYHLLHGRLFRTLEATLTDLEFVEALLTAGAGFSWIDDLASSCVAFELKLALQTAEANAPGLGLEAETRMGLGFGLLSPQSPSQTPRHLVPPTPKRNGQFQSASLTRSQSGLSAQNQQQQASSATAAGATLAGAGVQASQQASHLQQQQQLQQQNAEDLVEEEMIDRVRDYYAFAQRYTPELSGNPALVFQYAANLPDTNAASIAASKLWASETSRRPWLRWVNKIQEQGPCLVTLSGHTAPVLFVDISKDGKRVVSASEDCTIRVWIAATGESDFVLVGHKEAVTCAVISPDNPDVIVSTSRDGTARVWVKGVCALKFERHGRTPVLCCCISDCGRFVCTGDQSGALKIWEIFSEGECLHEFRFFPSAITMCRFSSDNEYIFCAGADNTIRGWRFKDGAQYMCKSGEAMCFAPNCADPQQKLMYCLRTSSMRLKIFDAEFVNQSLAQPSQIKAGELKAPAGGTPPGPQVLLREGTTMSLAERRGISGALGTPTRSQTILNTLRGPSSMQGSTASGLTAVSTTSVVGTSSLASKRPLTIQTVREDGSEDENLGAGGLGATPGSFLSSTRSSDGRGDADEDDESLSSEDALNRAVLRRSELARALLKDEEAHLATRCALSSTRRIAVAREDGNVSIFNVDTGEKVSVLHGHVARVNHCVYDSSGRTLVTASNDCSVKIWDPRRARLVANTPHKTKVVRTSFDKNNCLLSVSQEGCVCIWNAPTGVKTTMKSHDSAKDFVRDAGFAKNGEYYMTVSDVLRVATSRANEDQRTWMVPQQNTALWDISPCGRIVLCVETGSTDFHVWSLYSNPPKLLRTVTEAHERKITVCQFSADGALVYTAGNDGRIKVWNAVSLSAEKYSGSQFTTRLDLNQGETARPILILQDEKDLGLASLINSLHESPDGRKLLAISDSPDIKVFHLEAAVERFQTQIVTSLHAHDNRVTCAAWSRHPFTFASASVNGSIKVWASKTLECVSEISAHTSSILDIAFLPDGQRLASISSDKSLAIWNVATGDQVNGMSFPSQPCQLSISFEGRYLAVGTHNGDLRILEVMSETTQFPMVTARRYCNLTIKGKVWENRPKIDCVFCGHRFAINQNLDTLLSADNTSEALADLKFILRCSSCRHVLRATPIKLDRMQSLQRRLGVESRRRLRNFHQGPARAGLHSTSKTDASAGFYDTNLAVMAPFRRKRKVPKLSTSSKKIGIEQEADLMARHVHELKLRTQAKQYKTFHSRKLKPMARRRAPVLSPTSAADPRSARSPRSPRSPRAGSRVPCLNSPLGSPGSAADAGMVSFASGNLGVNGAVPECLEEESSELGAVRSIDADYLLREGCTLRRCATASVALRGPSLVQDRSLSRAVDFRSETHAFSVMHGGLPAPHIPQDAVDSLYSLALAPDFLDFGLVRERSVSTRSLHITNRSSTAIRLKVTTHCEHGDVELAVDKAPNRIIPGLSGSLVVKMTTTAPGVHLRASVRIFTSAGDTYTVPVRAVVASKADAAVVKAAQREKGAVSAAAAAVLLDAVPTRPALPLTPSRMTSPAPKIPNAISSPTDHGRAESNKSFFDDGDNPLSPNDDAAAA